MGQVYTRKRGALTRSIALACLIGALVVAPLTLFSERASGEETQASAPGDVLPILLKTYAAALESGDEEQRRNTVEDFIAAGPEDLDLPPATFAEMLASMADDALAADDARAALDLYDLAYAELRRTKGTRVPDLIAVLLGRARAKEFLDAPEEAILDYDSALRLGAAIYGVESEGMIWIYEAAKAYALRQDSQVDADALESRIERSRRSRQQTAFEIASEEVDEAAEGEADEAASPPTEPEAAPGAEPEAEAPAVPSVIGDVTAIINPDEADAPYEKVVVYYGTSRNRNPACTDNIADCPPHQVYGASTSDVSYGRVVVSVPRQRPIGSLPQPSIWRGEFRPDPGKHVVILKIDPMKQSVYKAALRNTIDQAGGRREAFVFIHGFSVSFPDAAKRTAQLAADLEIQGAPIFYSWPSRGNLLSYVADGQTLTDDATNQLKDFLLDIAEKSGADRVHIAAHSMGNRYLLSALNALAEEEPEVAKPLFNEVVLAAPDVDRDDFIEQIDTVRRLGENFTLYASRRDTALQIANRVNRLRRAGDATDPILLTGLDTVDTTEASGGLLGHADFAGTALDDFRSIIWLSLPPAERCLLRPDPLDNGTVWGFGEGLCAERVFNTAITFMRRIGPEETKTLLGNQIDLVRASGDQESAQTWEQVLSLVEEIAG
ncbi:MAG: alpha/beta hydrolase [Pseudomonadota bacterium]